MQTENRFLDDLARVATGALGVAAGMRSEAETLLRQRFERFLSDMDLVPREDFEAVKAMAAEARAAQAALEKRIAALEKTLAGKAAAGRKKTSPKAAGKKN